MKNYYEALGVAHDATPAIIKIAYEGQVKALEKAGLGEAERKEEEKLLTQAYVTLSNPAKRAWYDKRLEEHFERRKPKSRVPAAGVVVFVAMLVLGGGGWLVSARMAQKEKIRLEEQRLALERERAERQAELEAERLALERDRLERSSKYAAERESRYAAAQFARDRRANDYSSSYLARAESHDAQRERYEKQRQEAIDRAKEDRDRRQAAEDQRKAWAEVERQKRFVAEREREEERIRAEKHYRAQREAEVARQRVDTTRPDWAK